MKYLVLIFALLAAPAFAVNPDEMLDNPALEARARDISKGLRCLVCRNQSIDDSNATIARDMRILLRERLAAGDTNDEVVAYFVDRFGDFVLLKPPVQANTYLLWIGPLLILAAAAGGFTLYLKRRPTETAIEPLTDEDKMLARQLLEDSP